MKKLSYIFTILAMILGLGLGSAAAQSSGPRIKGNVYGGGENAKVMGKELKDGEWKNAPAESVSAKVTVNNGEVCSNVYGAGKGVTKADAPASGTDADGKPIAKLTYDQIATVSGSTEVNIDSTLVGGHGTVWGNVYGGAALAIVTGNTQVNIAGGKFAGDVFGGGKGDVSETAEVTSANVLMNTSVKVKAGEIIWDKMANENKEIVEWGSGNDSIFFDTEKRKYKTDHNIYAGGDIACTVGTWRDANTLKDTKTGTSSLIMTRGLLGSDLLNSYGWKAAFSEHENPHFYAFGGGYGIYTKAHKSEVNICLPMVSDISASGGDQQLARPRRAPGDNNTVELPVITDAYGVAWTTVLGILGGGFNGHVEETNVLVGDATYAHRVYGGGLGSYQGWVEAGKPADMAAAATAVGKVGTVGPLKGEPSATKPVAQVTIAGGHIFGDVFGGGAGVESGKQVQADGTWSLDRTAASTTFTDFTEIARVKGNTLVETTSYETYLKGIGQSVNDDQRMQRAQIYGNVYGGGDVANVSGNTSVTLMAGNVFGYTFGAGYGRLKTQAADYTAIGNVTGNSTVKLDTIVWASAQKPANYIEENYVPRAWDDIYGGGRNGVTNLDATVNINGGYVGNNIFGGGLGNVSGVNITSADVKGNTKVTVTGGQYLWREIADINGNIKKFPATVPANYKGDYDGYDKPFDRNVIDNKMMLTPMFESIKDFFDYSKASYTRNHSIYGGGNVACKVGTYSDDSMLSSAAENTGKAVVDMQYGLFADTDIHWTDDEQWNLATLCRYLACENASNYQFGVFGGGYGANTKVGETEVRLRMGVLDSNKPKWNAYMGAIKKWYDALDPQEQADFYGGGVGVNAENRYLTARMARSINVPSHTVLTVAGGGLAGYVAGNTSVHQLERSGSLRVFGGGIGLRPSDIELASLTQAGADAMTYGQVGGNTSVDIEYGVVVKDVFGGGAGIESMQNNQGEYVDFINMARVKGNTDVHVHAQNNVPTQTLVYGRVFGGGDVANVGEESDAVTAPQNSADYADARTKVTVSSGCVFKDVFAGGSGRARELCSDQDGEGIYGYQKLGAVYGNTQLIIEQPAENGGNATWLWRDVYGGGQNGTVYGNTLVEINGGWLGYNVFGGGLGNLGSKYNPATSQDEEVVTSANVTQNTNVRVTGGQYCLSQTWDDVERNWEPVNKDDKGNSYSSQYDPKARNFIINHNIYGGGNIACTVGNDTWVNMSKGLIPADNRLGHKNPTNFFEEAEWSEIHDKHASPFFSVFGGGYGPNTHISHDSNVEVAIDGDVAPNKFDNPTDENLHLAFYDRQSLLDVIGGGYQGEVVENCNVTIRGNSFIRNVFGGAYYATVGNTIVNIIRSNIENVYGGGMMGDVKNDVRLTVGTETGGLLSAVEVKALNENLIVLRDVYGANDVAGYVGAESGPNGEIYITDDHKGVNLQLNGGHVFGSVYGGGNGNYLYRIDETVSMVTVEEDADIGDDKKETLYKVPLRASDFPSLMAMSDQQKLANVISYRPSAMRVDIDFKGNSTDDRLLVDGNIFGGGNSATINDFDGNDKGDDAKVHMNIGSHIIVGGVFLGSDGEALFGSKEGYMTSFPKVNNIRLFDAIDWTTPENQSIPLKFLPTPLAKRPEVYKNNLDLYFMPVEMVVMPEVTWGKQKKNNSVNLARKADDAARADYEHVPDAEDGVTDAEIGTFCCGGNRGNMDTGTNFHVYFPEGLTITDKIVGGCNNANYTYNIPGTYDENTGEWETLDHIGGFLLGSHGVGTNRQPQIQLTMRNKFKITETQDVEGETCYAQKGNVFGGCYEKGIVRGDILVEVFSNMLMSGRDGSGNVCGLDSVMLRRTTDKGLSVASIYGAGFGPETWVRGDTEVRLGDETVDSKSHDGNGNLYNMPSGASCNYIFGGGRQGNVIGNTNVQIKNGRVGGCVVGASYAGLLYGSAQTMVGFPELYYRAKVSRSYDVLRADEDPAHASYLGDNGKELIQKKVYYTKGDLVTATVYNGIRDRIVENERQKAKTAGNAFDKAAAIAAAETELKDYFDVEHSIPAGNDWRKVDIQIDKAIYGGGYALATGAGSYTVLKYTDEHKFLDSDILKTYGFSETGTAGWDNTFNETTDDFIKYGGNTFVIVGDVSGNYDRLAETDKDFSSIGGHAALQPAEKERDHITLSSRQLRPLKMKIGDDLFGLFKELTVREANPTLHTEEEWSTTYLEEGRQPSGQYMKITYDASYTTEDRQNGSRFYEFTGEGGVYGDGRLSVSEGFRVCDAIGYGYNGTTPKSPKLMNCIHRFDMARFKDCCITLLGDRDYTSAKGSEANAVAYSIARVAEILMESSIPQNKDYLDPSAKYSRNYIGLSSSQFDLSAVKSNDVFGDDSDAALYHNKKGEVITTSMEIEGAESKTFPAEWSYYNVKKWYLSEYNTDIDKSGYYDDANAQVRNEMQFQLRNSATARNMFGIFSGYALNVFSTHYVDKKPESYYGPVVGVFEVDLIGTRDGEAGGYAYAQNIHKENAKDDAGNDVMKDSEHIHSFLETSGNFVFPATSVRKVVDNCTPIAYNSDTRDAAEGHYWYVTGFKYYYNATITGYTYDGKTKYFDSDNSISKRLVLSGTKQNQFVVLKNFHWLPRHAVEYYETVEEYNAAKGTTLTKDEFAALPDDQKIALDRQEMCDIEAKYLTRKDGGNYSGAYAENTTNWQNTILADDRQNTPFYNLSLSLSEFGNYMDTTIDGENLPVMAIMPQDNYTMSTGADSYKIYQDQDTKIESEQTKMSMGATISNPIVGIRLTDCVNNNGKDADGISYFSKYLDDPCVAKIVLTTPAINDNGERMWSAYSEVNPTDVTSDTRSDDEYGKDPYYIVNANGDYVTVTLADAKTQVGKHVTVFQIQKDVYELVKDDMTYNSSMKYYTLDGQGGYTETSVTDASDYAVRKSDLYYLKTPAAHEENYVYDITLTIKYIKGPSYEGRIDIKNCALPGEMIRLSHENVQIESDVFSLPHNGSYWTFGPGKKVFNDPDHPENGYHWELIDETGTLKRQDASGQIYNYNNPATRNLYYPYNPNVNDPLDNFQKRPVSPIMRTGVYHDNVSTDKPDYFVPAYYFMNGYVAQYSFTVNGIDEVFTTTIHPEDTLLVHNYHRMAKAATAVGYDNADDIKLGHAVKEHGVIPDRRQLIDVNQYEEGSDPYTLAVQHNEIEEQLQTALAAEWPLVHKRPRVYIQDVEDLRAFADYLNRKDDQTANAEIRKKVEASGSKPEEPAVKLEYVQRYGTDYGNDVDFFLMANIEVPSNWTPIANFKGRLHGNGHVITGLGKLAENKRALFAEIDETAHIYNLGLQSGSIAKSEKPAAYSNCYTFANKTVYHKDGKADTHYTDDDWRTGRVAYDLNEYYLAERLDRKEDSDDDHVHMGYVESLYADGDYRYSRFSAKEADSEYLRSNNTPNYLWGYLQSLVDEPERVSYHYYHYNSATHQLTHKVDEARAFYENVGDPETAVFNEYRPLFDEAKLNTPVEPVPAAQTKNDYIFFGQTINKASYTNPLGTVGSSMPTVIDANSSTTSAASYHNVAEQGNRVWRAYGFYRSKADDAFHFNKAAWALHPELTAIDFTGLHEPLHEWAADYAPSEATPATSKIFYPKVMDMPDALTSFNVYSNKDITPYSNATEGHVSQNLLVYNNGEPVFAYKDVNNSAESSVLYHNLVKSSDPATFGTDYFHLVDKQDFNAPIEFKVNTRAWYERLPQAYRNVDEGYGAGTAWEGICLPFTATKVTADVNGEISHFFGATEDAEHSLHHEYWLRGFTGIQNGDDNTLATFVRPAASGDGFFTEGRQTAVKFDYTYPKNDYFTSLYNYNPHYETRDDEGDDTMGKHVEAWYAQPHTFADYVPLTAAVPYIVAFPGDDFYEFSMESEYDTASDGAYGWTRHLQKATFERGATDILVSDDIETSTSVETYTHQGTYLHQSSVYGINDEGTAFEEDEPVLPFRTYMMKTAATPAPTRGIIAIGSIDGGEEEPIEPAKPSLELQYRGREVIVTSTYNTMVPLEVFNSVGQLILIHKATTGTTSFELPYAGAFVINGDKVMIR